MKQKQPLIVIVVTLLSVICITILRDFPPLSGIFEFFEAVWGQPIVIGLQAGIGAGAGISVLHLYQNKHDEG